MLVSSGFFTFILVTYGLAFLIADAHIFGCDAGTYKSYEGSPDEYEAYKIGIIKIRPYLMRFEFFNEQFNCYFCLGVWCGVFLHWPLRYLYGDAYWIPHSPTHLGWTIAIACSALASAPCCYIVNLVVKRLEQIEDN